MQKILVIEDEPIQLDLIADRLGMEFSGIHIDKAVSMVAAKEFLKTNQYKIVIADLLEGQTNRHELIKKMAKDNEESTFVIYTVAPEMLPEDCVDNKQTYLVDKLKPIEEGLLELVKQELAREKYPSSSLRVTGK